MLFLGMYRGIGCGVMKKIGTLAISVMLTVSLCFPPLAWAELGETVLVSDSSGDMLAGKDPGASQPSDTGVGQEEAPPSLGDQSVTDSDNGVSSDDTGGTAVDEDDAQSLLPDDVDSSDEKAAFLLSEERSVVPRVSTIRTALSETKVLDIPSGLKSDAVGVQLYNDNSTGAQRFQLKDAGNGYYIVSNVNSGKVLDVRAGNTANGTLVQQYMANGTDAQLWSFVPTQDGDGSYYIESKLKRNLVLDVQWGASRNGTPLQVYAANGSTAQKFYLEGFDRILEDGSYVIGSSVASTVLDVSAASVTNGANIQMYQPNQTAAQTFSLKYDESSGYYEIYTFAQDKVLDVVGAGNTPGTNVWQYEANGSMAQKWSIVSALDGSGYAMISACSGLALDIVGASRASGANVQTYTENNTPAQIWMFEKPSDNTSSWEDGLYSIRSAINVNFAIDVTAANTADGANVQLYTFNNSWAQKFRIEQQRGGYCSIRALHSGKALEVASASATSGTNVQQNSYTGSDVQLWTPIDLGGGAYSFQSKSSGLYLDVSGAIPANGSNIWVYAGNESAAQKFKVDSINASTGMTEGSYVIKSKIDGNVVDITSASTNNGAKAQLHSPNGTFAQKFKLLSAGSWQYYLVNVHSSKYLDVDTNEKSTLQQWDRTQAANQKWDFYPVDENQSFFYIRSPYTNQYLTNIDGAISLAAYTGGDNQAFALEATSAFKVYLDAGHGYNSNGNGVIDPGAISRVYQEYQLAEDLVQSIKEELNARGVEYYVGYGSAYWDRHQEAVNMGCSTFVSIHFNSSGGMGTGTESYIHSYNAAAGSPVLQNIIHRYMVEGTALPDRGKKKEEFAVCGGRLPSVLCEIAFIDNISDMAIYNTRRDNVAVFMAAGIQEASKNTACGWY